MSKLTPEESVQAKIMGTQIQQTIVTDIPKTTKLGELRKLMISDEDLRYNEEGKQRFSRVGKKAMKELAEILELDPYDINFNKGGIAVSGDLRLMGMINGETGIYISMNKDFPYMTWGGVLIRSIKHMKDYTGGSNNYIRFEDIDNPDEFLRFKRRLVK